MAAPTLFPSGDSLHAHRIRMLYFMYFANVGLMVTFWPYHMQALGMSAAGIGTLFSVRTAIGIGAQLILPPMSDRSGDPARFLKICILLIVVFTASLPLVENPQLFIALMWLATPWEGALVTILDSTTIRLGGDRRYGSIRLWGSVGYGAIVALFGLIASDLSHRTAGSLAVPVGVGLLGVTAIIALTLPSTTYQKTPASRQRRLAFSLLSTPGLPLFLSFNVLHWAAVMMFNLFIALHAQTMGLGPATPGLAVMVSIIGEVAALSMARRLLDRVSASSLLAVIMALGALRWAGTAAADSATTLIAWQLLHFFTFGAWLPAVMSVLNRFTTMDRRASLQGLYAAIVYGFGGVLGSGVGGLLMQYRGGRALFYTAAGAELLAFVVLMLGWKRWQPERAI